MGNSYNIGDEFDNLNWRIRCGVAAIVAYTARLHGLLAGWDGQGKLHLEKIEDISSI